MNLIRSLTPALFSLWLALALLAVHTASAQPQSDAPAEAASQVEQPQAGGAQTNAAESLLDAAERTELNDLIALLESETARTEFIDRLKMLNDIQQHKHESKLAVSELLNLEDSSGELASRYSQLLQSLGLSDSQFGKIAVTLCALLALLLLAVTNRWLAHSVNQKLDSLRQRFSLAPNRLSLLPQLWSLLGAALCTALAVAAAAEIWDLRWFLPDGPASYLGLINGVLTLGVLALLYAVFWEFSNAALEYAMRHARAMSDARADTVLPIVRRVILIILVVIFTLIALSELGIDIMPLVAGAGVFGIAIGFGAQTLVRDFLVGFTIVLEDLLQIGDIVKVAGRMGEVEKITMRKLQLRSLDGTVHTIPFSELDVVENFTKEYSYYLTDIGVAYKEDIDAVIACAKDVAQALKADDQFGPMMLDNIEILGVDQFADSAVVIRARLKTRAHDKWTLGREFNRRLKYAFDERNIEIPFPHRTLMLGEAIGDKLQPGTATQRNTKTADEDGQHSSSKAQTKRNAVDSTEGAPA